MKMSKWKEFADTCSMLGFNKRALMNLAYGTDWSGIDTALPQHLINNGTIRDDEIFYHVTDCSGINYRVVDLRDMISDNTVAFLSKYAHDKKELIDYIGANKGKLPDDGSTEKFEKAHKKYIAMVDID